MTWRDKLNITEHQHALLGLLQDNNLFIIVQSDKNLGSVIIDREQYIKMVLEGHLFDTNTYKRLMTGQLDTMEASVRIQIKRMITINTNRTTERR